jgi:RHS repeat-associated protein
LREELIQVMNAKGESAVLDYDAEGRCHRIRYFDGRVEEFRFDENDKAIALIDGEAGAPLAWAEYDGEFLIRESFPDGREVRVAYGVRGEITSLENEEVALLYEWDAGRRIVRQQSNEFTLDYTLDLRGDCTSALASNGRRIDYEWDGRRRLTRVVDRDRFSYDLRYDVRNLVTELRMPNGLVQRFEYDVLHRMATRRVLRADGGEVCSRRFTYDAAGRLSSFDDSIRGRREFAYDTVDNLRSVTDNATLTEQYQYDANGNPIVTRRGETITYASGDRMIRLGLDDYRYDERGNLTAIRSREGERRFAYTGEGRLRSAELLAGTVVAFEYDARARRVAKIVDGRRTTYHWNGAALLDEETDGEVTEYLFLPGSFFPVGMTVGGRHFSFVLDQLGTPTEVLDDAGNIVWSADYSAFGELIRRRIDTIVQPFRLLGQYHDVELDWHYARYRYYEPRTGRFTCPDPLGFNAGLNAYGYGPNAINWIDPLGLVHVSVDSATNTATCEVLSKCTWGTKTMKDARKKVSTFNEAKCTVDMSQPCAERESGAKEKYIANNASTEAERDALRQKLSDQGDPCKSIQVDHVKDVQCGGTNAPENLQELNQSVNASFGSQIRTCLSRLGSSFAGTVELKLVDRNVMTDADETNHKKKECDDSEKACP